MGSPEWQIPANVASSNEAAREDHGNTIHSNEFLDSPEVIHQKMQTLASLLVKSKRTNVYCGAGLSKESGLRDAASKDNSVTKQNTLVNGLFALPNSSQICLAKLHNKGLLQRAITQNHDGLLHKAGIPQEDVIEIHGGWYDPSNPQIKYTESLKNSLLSELKKESETTDLLLVLGTSLSGMTADRIAEKVSGRSVSQNSLGIVIINLQQTRLDHISSLRVWARLSEAFQILTTLLNLDEMENPIWKPEVSGSDIFHIPYNENGLPSQILHTLDLSIGATLKIVDPNAPNFNANLCVIGKGKADDWVLQEAAEA